MNPFPPFIASVPPLQPNELQEPRRKRVGQACDLCSKRKVKCDGSKPICGTCAKAGSECIYTPRNLKKKTQRSGYVASISQRLQDVEQLLATQSNPTLQGTISPQISDPFIQYAIEASQSSVATTQTTSDTNRTYLSETSNPVFELLNPELSKITGSTLSFDYLNASIQPLDQSGNLNSINGSDAIRRISMPVRATGNSAQLDWNLLNLYFEHVYPYLQIIPKTAFYQIADSEPEMLLNAMYAFAAKYEIKNGHFDPSAGKLYFELAKAKLIDTISTSSLSSVHAIYVLGYYAFFNGEVTLASSFFGLAIKAALRLGLSNEDTFDYEKNGYACFTMNQNVEIVRRLWWSLYVSDVFERRFGDQFYLIREEDCQTCLPGSDSRFWDKSNEKNEEWVPPGSQESRNQVAHLKSTVVFYPTLNSSCPAALIAQLHKLERRIQDFTRKVKDLSVDVSEQESELEMKQIEASLDFFDRGLNSKVKRYLESLEDIPDLQVNHEVWNSLYVLIYAGYLRFNLYRGRGDGYEKHGVPTISLKDTPFVENYRVSTVQVAKLVARFKDFNPMFLYVPPFITSILFEVGLTLVIASKMCSHPSLIEESLTGLKVHVDALNQLNELTPCGARYRDILTKMDSVRLESSTSFEDQYVVLQAEIRSAVVGVMNMK